MLLWCLWYFSFAADFYSLHYFYCCCKRFDAGKLEINSSFYHFLIFYFFYEEYFYWLHFLMHCYYYAYDFFFCCWFSFSLLFLLLLQTFRCRLVGDVTMFCWKLSFSWRSHTLIKINIIIERKIYKKKKCCPAFFFFNLFLELLRWLYFKNAFEYNEAPSFQRTDARV